MLVARLVLAALQQDPDPVCRVEAQWLNTPAPATVAASPTRLNLFSAVARPSVCGAATVRLTFTMLDRNERAICSGAIDDVAGHATATQVTVLELQPLNLLQFVRWVNRPPRPVRFERLTCVSVENVAEVQPGELDTAIWMRVHATVQARYGAISTADFTLRIRQ